MENTNNNFTKTYKSGDIYTFLKGKGVSEGTCTYMANELSAKLIGDDYHLDSDELEDWLTTDLNYSEMDIYNFQMEVQSYIQTRIKSLN